MGPLLINAFFTTTLFLFTSVAILCYLYLKYAVYSFWDKNGVPHEKSSIPFGNVPLSYFTGKTTHGTIIKESYMKFKKSRFHGIYILYEPILVINDLELIRQVLVKNFTQFYNRGRLMDEHKDALTVNLSNMNNDQWKSHRAKLSPAFTSGKLKLMYPLIEEICHKLTEAIDKALLKGDEIEIKDVATKFTIDCIASIAYGFNADSLNNSDSSFYKYGKGSGYIGRLYMLIFLFTPQLIKFMPLPKTRKLNEKYFTDLFINMVEYRRKENISRNDLLHMIMQLVDYGKIEENNSTENKNLSNEQLDKMTMMEGVGQSFTFFSADLDTTTAVVVCCLYELARNPDIQSKLFHEISEAHNSNGGPTYEKLFGMQYLDMVFQETLRRYPTGAYLTRICTEDFEIPDSKFVVKKGMRTIIPTAGLHADPDIYPEPEKFDPTRFAPENIASRQNFTFLPFGDGPRQCIAKRLGILKSKMAIYYLVLNYRLFACEKTPKTISLLRDHIIQIPCNMLLKMEKRKLQDNMTN